MKQFFYRATDDYGDLSNADQHRYFGEDLKAGRSTIAVFRNPDPHTLVAVWSAGDWRGFNVVGGERCVFTQTDTQRRSVMEFQYVVPSVEAAKACKGTKVRHWTLK